MFFTGGRSVPVRGLPFPCKAVGKLQGCQNLFVSMVLNEAKDPGYIFALTIESSQRRTQMKMKKLKAHE